MLIQIISNSTTLTNWSLQYSTQSITALKVISYTILETQTFEINYKTLTKYCSTQHSVAVCLIRLTSPYKDRFIKVTANSMVLETQDMYPCVFGGILIIDGIFPQSTVPILKWCTTMVPKFPAIRTSGQEASIIVLFYTKLQSKFAFVFEFALDNCQGINLCSADLSNINMVSASMTGGYP